MKRTFLTFLLVLSAATLARSQNWPQFRGPGASGVVEGQSAAAKWDAEKSLNTRWKTVIPGSGIPVR